MKNIAYKLILLLVVPILAGCEEFLDAKPTKDIVLPNTLGTLQSLLDNNNDFNQDLSLNLLGANEFQTDGQGIQVYTAWQRNCYLWKEKPFDQDEQIPEWSIPYRQIFISNNIISQLEKIEDKSQVDFEEVKGAAHFFRANAYFNLSQLFLPPLNNVDAYPGDYMIPYKVSEVVTFSPELAGVKEVFELIFSDIKIAIEYLPTSTEFLTRPSKWAAHGLYSRICLAVEEYDEALAQARLVLDHNDGRLLDYNELNPNAIYPFQNFNREMLFYSTMTSYSFGSSQLSQVDSTLYNSYDSLDIRKQLFFTTRANGNINFTGSYTGNVLHFSGIAVDEMLLISAECKIRLGAVSGGIEDLNTLLKNRWKTEQFESFETLSNEDALALVLAERKKELAFRGLRWQDLRRLNSDPSFQETLVRRLEESEYSLEPNSPRYIYPIPPVEKSFY